MPDPTAPIAPIDAERDLAPETTGSPDAPDAGPATAPAQTDATIRDKSPAESAPKASCETFLDLSDQQRAHLIGLKMRDGRG